jgi:SAM-dependent methyltransferase
MLVRLCEDQVAAMKNHNADSVAFDRKDHWEKVYSDRTSTEVSWYQQHPQQSLELIIATGVDTSARIIDIGGGASTLVDFLLDAGYKNISVLDISHGAIEQAKSRLGQYTDGRADSVVWLEQDITGFTADEPFDVWHDRAVFHFLSSEDERSKYVNTMAGALKQGAHVIIATFGPDGPEKCSGLDVVRYSPETMSVVLGDSFQLVETREEEHITPSTGRQSFIYCRFKRL